MAVKVDNWVILLYVLVLALVISQVWLQSNQVKTRVMTREVPVSDQVETRPLHESSILPTEAALPINVPTQGYYGDFHLIGYLQPLTKRSDSDHESTAIDKLRKPGCKHTRRLGQAADEDYERPTNDRNPEQMLRLYGRQINSYRYEYYVTNHWDPQIKISLDIPREEELTDGDTVRVPGYGPFRVVTYQPAYPGYI